MVNQWQKYLDTLDKKKKIILSNILIKIISKDWDGLDIKPLTNKKGFFRCRIGTIRIVFYIEKNNIIVDKIGPRGDVYK